MRWFKHMTSARNDEFVRELMFKWQSDGYVAWFATMELVAEQGVRLHGGKWVARISATPRVFSDATKIAPDRLEVIYEYCNKKKKLRFRRDEKSEEWVIDWPKVLKYRDEYTEKLMADTEKPPPPRHAPKPKSKPAPPTTREPSAAAPPPPTEVKKLAELLEDEGSRTAFLEFVGTLEHDPAMKNGRVMRVAREVYNLHESLENEKDSGLNVAQVWSYSLRQAMRHNAKSSEYVAKVLRTAVVKAREGVPLK